MTMTTTTPALPFMLLFLSAALCAPALAQDIVVVKDTDGHDLRKGVDYYILAATQGNGGGLTLGNTTYPNGTRRCPPYVVQHPDEANHGLPVTFSPVNASLSVVPLVTDFNAKFSAATTCVQSTVWSLGQDDDSTGKLVVTTGGVEGNPGSETLSNWFRIEEYEDAYKLVFCPSVCSITCRPVCGDLGIFYNSGIRHLAISDQPFKVVFKKA
ncbi:kunitz trypsin inhibitor 5-like [Diospyros lotus]|uniref:kunitz trypsin inhibitor 5-like n=1 Tax=Diospyros lotus TaxID=55363 RepID=UPI002251C093|nr:kunitz trypsin inhibitor 5-like [Diospyros lotus]